VFFVVSRVVSETLPARFTRGQPFSKLFARRADHADVQLHSRVMPTSASDVPASYVVGLLVLRAVAGSVAAVGFLSYSLFPSFCGGLQLERRDKG